MHESSMHVSEPILCYKGTIEKPRWMDVDEGMFYSNNIGSIELENICVMFLEMYSTLCHLEADIPRSQWQQPFLPFFRLLGLRAPFHEVKVDIVLSFGLTELKAEICWTENVRILPFV